MAGDPSWPWDMLQGIGTVGAVLVASYQIHKYQKSQKGWETLKACERYETDAVLDRSLLAIKAARDAQTLQANPYEVRIELTAILNYLDGIAIGVLENFYVEDIVREHLEGIMREHVEEFLNPQISAAAEYSESDWACLMKLLQKWSGSKTKGYRF